MRRIYYIVASVMVAAGLTLPSAPTMAGKQVPFKAVLELYTSQGCSSCPPADKLLKSYIGRKDVIALSLPIDYWDYLGWKDTFAKPEFTKRQYGYTRSAQKWPTYTPQVIVNGVHHAVGSRSSEIDRAIARSHETLAGDSVPLSIRREGDRLVVSAGDAQDSATLKSATIWLALVRKSAAVKIGHGPSVENAGQTLHYYNIVRELSPIGTWKGKTMRIELPQGYLMQAGIDSCIVLLQAGKQGPIIGAAELAADS